MQVRLGVSYTILVLDGGKYIVTFISGRYNPEKNYAVPTEWEPKWDPEPRASLRSRERDLMPLSGVESQPCSPIALPTQLSWLPQLFLFIYFLLGNDRRVEKTA
jgi:hypothetical protein